MRLHRILGAGPDDAGHEVGPTHGGPGRVRGLHEGTIGKGAIAGHPRTRTDGSHRHVGRGVPVDEIPLEPADAIR